MLPGTAVPDEDIPSELQSGAPVLAADMPDMATQATAATQDPNAHVDTGVDAAHGAVGAAETAATMITGYYGALAGGLTYLGTLAATQDPDAAASVMQDVEDTLTYKPRSAAGKKSVEAVGNVAGEFGQQMEKSGVAHGMAPEAAHAFAQGAPWLFGLHPAVTRLTATSINPEELMKGFRGPGPSAEAAPEGAPQITGPSSGSGGGAGFSADELMNAAPEEAAHPVAPPAANAPTQHTRAAPDAHIVTSPNGVTAAQVVGNQLRISASQTAPEAQGKGEGTSRLTALGEQADDKGLTLASGPTADLKTVKQFDRYGKENDKTIVVNPHTTDPATGTLVSKDPNTPVLQVQSSDASKPAAPAPMIGLPSTVRVPGHGVLTVGPDPVARKLATDYQSKNGLTEAPPHTYAEIDPAKAAEIASAYDAMPHNPADPAVAASYAALARETKAQLDEILKTGLKVEFIKGKDDPYAASPRLAVQDIQHNNHLWVFPTDEGFGSSGFQPVGHPLLAPAGVTIDGRALNHNAVLRIVHDYFGHGKEGNGFRDRGEYNAWRIHRPMYSELAQGALATETLGQNAWVNYGPHGEKNRAAAGAATVYADQKAGLLPEKYWKRTSEPMTPEKASAAPLGETVAGGAQRGAVGVLRFRHFSNADKNSILLDPKMYGTGMRGAEAKRVANGAPKSISLYGEKHPDNRVEPGLRGKPEYSVSVPSKRMYDLSTDPKGFITKAKGDFTRVEQMIKSAGYLGYHLPDGDGIFRGQGRIFKPVQATRVKPLGEIIGGGKQRGAMGVPRAGTTAARVYKALTPDERNQLRTDTAKRVVEVFKNLPDTKELAAAALAGRAKKGWYEKASRAISAVFGPDAPRFTALLASLSPQTSVEANFANAVRSYVAWDKAGRPTDPKAIKKILGENVQGDKGEGSVLEAWVNNSIRSLTHPNPEQLVISGPKVDSFMRNLMRQVHAVTLDSWMAAFAKILPAKLGGSLRKQFNNPGKSTTYLGYSAKVREAAELVSKLTGTHWTPDQIQETIWAWAKVATEHANSFKGMATIPELVKDKEITHELIHGASDFHGLFHEPENAAVLAGSRYAEPAGNLPRESGPVAPDDSEAVQAAERDLAPHLESAANRLEVARQEKNARDAKSATSAAARGRGPGGRQRGSVGVWGTREDKVPAGQERPAASQKKVVDTLRSIGLDEVRASAITGDQGQASGDWHQAKLDNEGGHRIAQVIAGERGALGNYASGIVDSTGGTTGTDLGALHARGRAIVAPIDAFHEFIDEQIKALYEHAKGLAQQAKIQLPGVREFLTENRSKFINTVEGKQLLEGLTARMSELGLLGDNNDFKPATVEQAERMRQYAKQSWTPRTSDLLRQFVDTLDDDVMHQVGMDLFAAARKMRALRATHLDEPDGVARLLHVKEANRLGINRTVDFEKVPDEVTGQSLDQFQHIVRTIRRAAAGNPQIAPLSATALNEIRAQFANKLADAGNSLKGMWNAKAVDAYLKGNHAKMELVFKPDEMAKIDTLANAGNYLDIDASYPGAAVQGVNLVARGALGGIEKGGELAGAALGHTGGLLGVVVGGAVGHGAAKAATKIKAGMERKLVEKRIRKL